MAVNSGNQVPSLLTPKLVYILYGSTTYVHALPHLRFSLLETLAQGLYYRAMLGKESR